MNLSPDLKLPALEAQTETIVVYGGKGMGKTNFGSVFVEELDRNGLRFSYIDPVGVAWGLKHSSDGKGPGIEVLTLGGLHGDLPIEPTAGDVVADLVVDDEASVLIDISRMSSGRMWTQGEKIRFVRDYCIRLFQRQGERRRPLMQVIDEAGRFVPQQMPKNAADIAECVGAIEQLVELGRNVGVGVLLLTQRSARMNKSVSELAQMMVAFRTVGPRSIDSIIDWFAEHKRVVKGELEQQLRRLPRGTALVVSPGWLGVEGEYAMRARETFDSSDTPVSGTERRPRGKGATIDRDKYLARMADTIEKAKAEDPRELRRTVGELKRQLQQRPKEKPEQVEVKVPVEVPVVREEDVEQLERILAPAVNGMSALLQDAQVLLKELRDRAGATPPASLPAREAPARRGRDLGGTDDAPARRERRRPAEAPPAASGDVEITGPQQRVLDALAWWDAVGYTPATKIQVGFIAGYRVGKKVGGTYGNVLGELRSAGLLDYPGHGYVQLTERGHDLAAPPDIDPTTDGLQQAVYARLDGPERRVLQVLVEEYPDSLPKQEVGERSGYTVGDKVGGTFGNILGRLRSLGLIDYPQPGQAAALPVLFLEEWSPSARAARG